MKTNPIAVAIKAKGASQVVRRANSIVKRYGLGSVGMDQSLQLFSQVLAQFNCGATFPITAVTLKRHQAVLEKYFNSSIEFAVHGFTHVDYSRLSPREQMDHLQRARHVFIEAGIQPVGFRSPYLSRDDHLPAALQEMGFLYVSNQPYFWDVVDRQRLDPVAVERFERAITFYRAWHAGEQLSLPNVSGDLLDIPVSLPDDEILIERLNASSQLIENSWKQILSLTYQTGDLFTLQLHPERIKPCAEALIAVLTEARALKPGVWLARLDEIAYWWKAKAGISWEITDTNQTGGYLAVVDGPPDMTILGRGIEVEAPNSIWMNGYQQINASRFAFQSKRRPVIGVSPSTSQRLVNFLRQQGYFLEMSEKQEKFTYYLDQEQFDSRHEKKIIDQIEDSNCALLKTGCWPAGARSALAITGDIDALTIYDYGLRMIGK
jgi:hypothetical protein